MSGTWPIFSLGLLSLGSKRHFGTGWRSARRTSNHIEDGAPSMAMAAAGGRRISSPVLEKLISTYP